jgi:D-glycero-D-manno-heptose 1,7-bisphosphate phosphatase
VINAVTLRDGVTRPPSSVGDLELLPGVVESCRALADAGYLLLVVTNQPDVARGSQQRAVVEELNDAVRGLLPLTEMLTCYHDDTDGCACRKPRPGMLLDAADRWDIDLRRSFLVGDRWSDVEAGRAAGCVTALVDSGFGSRELCEPDWVVSDLADAARRILETSEATCDR